METMLSGKLSGNRSAIHLLKSGLGGEKRHDPSSG
jgi:hypothetical protein